MLLSCVACASYQHGIIDTRPVDTYQNRVTVEGVSTAADAYDSSEKAQKGFYVDVTSEGFYPVQLIFKNDTNDRVIVLRETLELVTSSGTIYRPVRSTIMYNTFEKSKMAYALLGFGIFSYMSAEEANRKMEADWRDKELPEQLIILSGLRANGFIYLQLPKGTTTKGAKLTMEAEKLETRQKFKLELRL
jgi:hypothetical protein